MTYIDNDKSFDDHYNKMLTIQRMVIEEVVPYLLGTTPDFNFVTEANAGTPKTAFNSTYIKDNLYPVLDKAFSDKANKDKFKRDIDKFLSENIGRLNVMGPLKAISFPKSSIDNVLDCTGLDAKVISKTVSEMKKSRDGSDSANIFATPVYVAITLATRYFILQKSKLKKNDTSKEAKEVDDMLKRCIYYITVPIYALLQKKYYPRCEPNPAIMEYAISNMIEKNRIKQTGSMLDTIYITGQGCLDFYFDKLKVGDDESITQYISAVRTRINSIMRKITNAYNDAFKEKQYIQVEKEDMSDESYYQADSNSQFINRTTNKVVQTLIVNGPDMKLVEISAKNNGISVSNLRSYIITICSDKHQVELTNLIEALLILFFNSEDSKDYTIRDLSTDKFLFFALNVYQKANTKNEHVIKVKTILDKWMEELHVYEKSGAKTTIHATRRALFMFFVMSIIKICK